MQSVLIVNANDPKMLLDAQLFGADALMFDLTKPDEAERDVARILLQEAVAFLGYKTASIIVRANSPDTEDGEMDIKTLAQSNPYAFVIACSGAETVKRAEALAQEIEQSSVTTKIRFILAPDVGISDEGFKVLIAASKRISAVFLPADMSRFIHISSGADIPVIAAPPVNPQDARDLGFSGAATENGGEVDGINEIFSEGRCGV